MKNLFNFFTKNKVQVNENSNVITMSKNDMIIKEIHDSFFNEINNLLESAKQMNSLETDKQELLNKCSRLEKLGFTKTAEVQEAQSELTRLEKLKKDNANKELLFNAINYFSQRYPLYKFITVDSVKLICAKYGLVYAEAEKYIGTVPDKNLKQIENFKIDEKDKCYQRDSQYSWENKFIFEDYGHYKAYIDFEFNLKIERPRIYLSPLEIVAPMKDFNFDSDDEIKDFKITKIQVPDPIVLQPVMFEQTKFYLIITAWGLEAEDQNIVNEKFN